MRRPSSIAFVSLALGACSSFSGSPGAPDSGVPSSDATAPDAGPPGADGSVVDAAVPECRGRSFNSPIPVQVLGIDDGILAYRPILGPGDGTGFGITDTRQLFSVPTTNDGSPSAVAVTDLLAGTGLALAQSPMATNDGLTLFVEGKLSGKPTRIYTVSRKVLGIGFSNPVVLQELRPAEEVVEPWILQGGKTLYFVAYATATPPVPTAPRKMYVAHRESGAYGPAAPLDGANRSPADGSPVVTADERLLIFASGLITSRDIFMSTRPDSKSAWSKPVPLPELTTPREEFPTWISDDGCTIYLSRNDVDGVKLYRATR